MKRLIKLPPHEIYKLTDFRDLSQAGIFYVTRIDANLDTVRQRQKLRDLINGKSKIVLSIPLQGIVYDYTVHSDRAYQISTSKEEIFAKSGNITRVLMMDKSEDILNPKVDVYLINGPTDPKNRTHTFFKEVPATQLWSHTLLPYLKSYYGVIE